VVVDAVKVGAFVAEGENLMSRIEARLKELGISLPTPVAPIANYAPYSRLRSMLIISGQLPIGLDGRLALEHVGKLAPGVDGGPAKAAARLCAINLLAQARSALGDLDLIGGVKRLGGFFNVAGSYDALPQAMNGASDLMAEVFGERGRHARTTVGVAHLPLNALVEVEAIFEVN
jgi:enamine deaminase RidA (YjgF/YER057c/UK114 family)